MRFLAWPLTILCAAILLGCSSGGSDSDEPAAPTSVPATLPPAATATPAPTATPTPVRKDIQATRLVIPSLSIDSTVQRSQVIPYTDVPLPGCPARPQDTSTTTVPNQGIATPVDLLEGLENKAWIYGHSRWLGVNGTFYTIQDLKLGDEIIVDGVDRQSGAPVTGQKFVVDGIFLTDVDSGEELINADGPADIPAKPQIILQTSVRENGVGKQWILDQAKLNAKAKNLVQGDINDPCKYLLLFVYGTAVS